MRKRIALFVVLVGLGSFWLSPRQTVYGQSGAGPTRVHLPFLANNYLSPLRTQIIDVVEFLEACPNTDPAYSQIRSEFTLRRDGVVVGPVACTGPYSALPVSQLTQELITLQTMRAAYYMDPGLPGYLPWTPLSLYAWMTSTVAGINLVTAPGQLYCCDTFDSELYIVQSVQTDDQRDFKRTWMGISSTLDYFVHEIRHADGGPGHTTGCLVFPNPTDPPGCDQSYDVLNMGSYGTQYWLNDSWMTGYLNIGISCTPAVALEYITWHQGAINVYRERFVDNIPPVQPDPTPPYGGPCCAP
jgi:hypothetical protein